MPIFTWNLQKVETKATLLSNINLSEPFVARLWGLLDILKWTNYQNQKKINDAILCVLTDSLLPAHISLENIRKHLTVAGIAEIDKQKDYLDLYNHLWFGYKDRMQAVFAGTNFEIGFLFQEDKEFNQGIDKLKLIFPNISKSFFDSITLNRNTWQKDMEVIRNNYTQHRNIDFEVVQKFFVPKVAEDMFNILWQSIEQIVLTFLLQKFQSQGLIIVEIPKQQRDPVMPKRYKVSPPII